MSEETSNNAALIAAMEKYCKVQGMVIKNSEGTEVNIIAAPEGQELHSVQRMLNDYLTKPKRLTGHSQHETLDSFIEHVNAFKIEDRTVIFATHENGRLCAVYNYHTKDETSFNDHRAQYQMVASKEWKNWMDKDGRGMSQSEFAAFIEDNALDLIVPPTDGAKDADKAIMGLAKTLNTKYASPSQMMELARGIKIHESASGAAAYDMQTGDTTIEYASISKASTKDGNKLAVPGMFLLGIPVVMNGDAYRIPVRLRYRMDNGRVVWFYQIYKPEKYLKDAFDDICVNAQKEAEVPLYHGSPEASSFGSFE